MTTNVTAAAALAAGTLSFLSPCVLPLVPPYLVYLTGSSVDQLAGDRSPTGPSGSPGGRDAMIAAPLFVLGFSTVFVALGASASVIGGLVRSYSGLLATISGIIIIAMGLHFLGVTRFAFLLREKRFGMTKPIGLWGAYAMGFAFAFGWTPCIGPILAAILAVAGSEATVAKGASLLAIYSLGLGIPFMLAAFAVRPFVAFLARFRTYLGLVEKVMGGLLVLTGVAFLSGFISQASYWLLEAFPTLGQIG
jgi:cytochrome c-type biogenesis protein